MDIEIQTMLEKKAIEIVNIPTPGQYLSSIFLVPKKETGQRPVVNLKRLNKHIPDIHFKMESISLLKEMLQQGNYMWKIDLKDAYFSVPLHKESQKYIRFQWKGRLYQFLCLCFGLVPAPRIFTKLMKVPISLLRRLNIRLIVFLDDILILAKTFQEAEMTRNTLIFVLQHLGFTINFPKSMWKPVQLILFLGVEVDSLELKSSLPKEKMENIVSQCQDLLKAKTVTVRELTQLVGRLSSAAIAVLPAPLQYRAMQRQQILELSHQQDYDTPIILSKEVREELNWWIQNLHLSNSCCC